MDSDKILKYSDEVQAFTDLYCGIWELYHMMTLRSGLSESAFLIFSAIIELGEGCCQKDIAKRYSISRQTLSSSVHSLIANNYIYLMPGQRRDCPILLTEIGKQLLEKHLSTIVELENSVFQTMTENERREFLLLFRKCFDLYSQKFNSLSSED